MSTAQWLRMVASSPSLKSAAAAGASRRLKADALPPPPDHLVSLFVRTQSAGEVGRARPGCRVARLRDIRVHHSGGRAEKAIQTHEKYVIPLSKVQGSQAQPLRWPY